MDLNIYFRYFTEYAMIFLYAFYCYIPVKEHTVFHKSKIALFAVPVLLLYCSIGSALSTVLDIIPNKVLFPCAVIFFILYYKSLCLDIFKCLFIFFHVCSMVCYPCLYAIVFDALHDANGHFARLSYISLFFQYGLLIILLIIYIWLRKWLAWLIDNVTSKTIWHGMWLFPLFYMVVLIMIIPVNYNNLLYRGKSAFLYLIIITAIFISEMMIIFLFYKASYEVQKNTELKYQNQFLEISSHQYNLLLEHMKETRQIHHDFRQHLYIIHSLVINNSFNDLKEYLAKYIPLCSEIEIQYLCKNNSVNAIANYYHQQAGQHHIHIHWMLDLPEVLPVKEPIFCGMLGNLLENAIDGCATVTDAEKLIKVSCDMPSDSMLILMIENNHKSIIKKSCNNKDFLSVKHDGIGIGLTSVKAVVEKYHGVMDIHYDETMFSVNIILNI